MGSALYNVGCSAGAAKSPTGVPWSSPPRRHARPGALHRHLKARKVRAVRLLDLRHLRTQAHIPHRQAANLLRSPTPAPDAIQWWLPWARARPLRRPPRPPGIRPRCGAPHLFRQDARQHQQAAAGPAVARQARLQLDQRPPQDVGHHHAKHARARVPVLHTARARPRNGGSGPVTALKGVTGARHSCSSSRSLQSPRSAACAGAAHPRPNGVPDHASASPGQAQRPPQPSAHEAPPPAPGALGRPVEGRTRRRPARPPARPSAQRCASPTAPAATHARQQTARGVRWLAVLPPERRWSCLTCTRGAQCPAVVPAGEAGGKRGPESHASLRCLCVSSASFHGPAF